MTDALEVLCNSYFGKPVILQRLFSAFKISISKLSGIFSVLPTVK